MKNESVTSHNNQADKRIKKFIRQHHVLTLATCLNNKPWCANCFYTYIEENNSLLFTSDIKTKHIQDILTQPVVSGSVVLETKIIGKIRGIQFTGIVFKPTGTEQKKYRQTYLKRFPYAVIKELDLWLLELHYIKMTDNRLGFGKKLIWENNKGYIYNFNR